MNRIDRLTAILIQLQTKRVVRAEEIASRFEISLRTVYRDVKALMEAGVPVGSEAGKGYFMVDGYHLPPVMFTRDEAGAMMLAGKLVEKMTDKSVAREFSSALAKIQAVLRAEEKDHLELLQQHMEVMGRPRRIEDFPDHFLTDIQRAVVAREVVQIDYFSSGNKELTTRNVEPIGVFYHATAWHLIAWCKLREGYRDFRTDHIRDLRRTGEKFDAVRLLSLKEYLSSLARDHAEMETVVVLFDKKWARFTGDTKYTFGFVAEEDLGETVRMTFVTGFPGGLYRWLLGFGKSATVESPDSAKSTIREIIAGLVHHYGLEQVTVQEQ